MGDASALDENPTFVQNQRMDSSNESATRTVPPLTPPRPLVKRPPAVASLDVRQAYAQYLSTHFGGSIREDDKSFFLQERYFQKNYLPHLPKHKDARIVDLGSGLGHFLFFLQRAGYTNMLGVDVGRECIDFCRAHGFPVVEEEICGYLEQHEEPVDAFILNDVLEHQTKDMMWPMLELIRSRLKPDGVFLVKVPNVAHPFLGTDSRYLDITHEVGFNENSLEQVLLMAGFTNVHVFGPDIYVTRNALLNAVARVVATILDKVFYALFAFYGRTETTIFRKNIIAVVRAPSRGPRTERLRASSPP